MAKEPYQRVIRRDGSWYWRTTPNPAFSGPRDSQRKRCYRWENATFMIYVPGTTFQMRQPDIMSGKRWPVLTLDYAKHVVNLISRQYWGRPRVCVEYKRACSAGAHVTTGGHDMRIGKKSITLPTILHEMAHSIVMINRWDRNEKGVKIDGGHDAEFIGVYVKLLVEWEVMPLSELSSSLSLAKIRWNSKYVRQFLAETGRAKWLRPIEETANV